MKIIDNINHILGEDLKTSLSQNDKLKIAASYFSIYAYAELKNELENIEELQFIFTTPTFVTDTITEKLTKEKREFVIPRSDRENSLYGTEFEIHLKNKLTQKAIAKECADWIRRKAKFKSNTSHTPMQELISIKQKNNTITYFPIQGFNPAGLGYEKSDATSNFSTRFEGQFSQQYLQLFNQIWHDHEKIEDVTPQIIQHIASVYQENDPERIYFLMLYHIFKDFLTEINDDVMPNEKTGYQDTLIWKKLFNFQKDAAIGIINKLESYNGCILADSVGLGKTFTALAVIKYYELRNKSVLVLCPKKLADNWRTYNTNLVTNLFAQDRFNYDVFYHTDLSRQNGNSGGIDLSKVNWGNYDLLVIDESHNFRNRDTFKDRTTRYQILMDKILRQGVKTKVLMLSATPVNNRFNDLKNQLALAYEGNPEQLQQKLDTERSIDMIFSRAQASFNQWSKLPAEERTTETILNLLDFDFFKLLDSLTIARSRKHIQNFYDTHDIAKFPTRLKPLSYRCAISTENNIKLNDIYHSLSQISMSVYAPVSYIQPSRLSKYEEIFDTIVSNNTKFKQTDREKNLQSLMTINLLKRLESSVQAFRLTLKELEKSIENVLAKIADFEERKNTGEISIAPEMGYDQDENGELLYTEDLIGKTLKIHLGDMDILSWQNELTTDLFIIQDLLEKITPVTPQKDAKLQHLISHIKNKMEHPINLNNKKVIIFTAFSDTADYLYQNLAPLFLQHFNIHTAKITGSQNQSTIKTQMGGRACYDMQGLLTLFSPISKQKEQVFPDEKNEIDILIATDCISEGQNLQDCDYLINFDIHWNPVRIIQRFGRVDRIGSRNNVIQLVNYWPDISLDEYINLRERVENRMVIVDMAGTGDDNVLTTKANELAYRKAQLKQLQNEVLDLEDANTGVSITDLGLNDFRMDLIHYMEQNPELAHSPKGLHTVVPAQPDIGLHAGVIFTLKARHKEYQHNNPNRLYPYYIVYIQENGQVVFDYTKAKYLLDVARKSCRGQNKAIPEVYESFNRRTQDGRDMRQYSKLLDIVIDKIRQVKQEKDIDSLFSGLTTSALSQDISGLNDFELISFIVIEEQ
ncbi:TPA: helicase-related protein [Pasteurella multocida]